MEMYADGPYPSAVEGAYVQQVWNKLGNLTFNN